MSFVVCLFFDTFQRNINRNILLGRAAYEISHKAKVLQFSRELINGRHQSLAEIESI